MDRVTLQDGESANVVSKNVEQLKLIFPEAFSEGGIDFDILRQLLGDEGVIDEGEEKYGLNWHGKKKARQNALIPSTGTLLPCPEESVNWDATKNIFVEGDNLEVLKLLQKSYAGKIRLIYIDPPYNTGGEFIYPDRFQENLDVYLRYTGQVDAEGARFTSNVETSGRKHTNWLNMMYPRLRLARSLLTADGFIFISIDDNESANLRKICDEIFGEENFIADVTWKHTQQSKNDEPYFSRNKNSLICYRKGAELKHLRLPRTEEDNKNYSNPDKDPKGDWRTGDVRSPSYRQTLKFNVTTPSGKIIAPPDNGWRWAESTLLEKIGTGEIVFSADETRIIRKIYLVEQEGRTPENVWQGERFGTTREANAEIKDLFDGSAPFDTPKPTKLIKTIMDLIGEDKDYTVLDFFAGSASTAHAVLEKNIADNASRRFIMVQLPEHIDEDSDVAKMGFKNIAEISKERIRRAIKKIESANENSGADLGFKVFKLSGSNIRSWNPDRADLEETLLSHQEHLIEGRSELDVLYELLLKRGIDLAAPIEAKEFSGKTVYSIGYGAMFACLDESLPHASIENVAKGILEWHEELKPASDTHVFFRDSAFSDDVAKTNMAAILEQNGISHVRSL